MIPDAPLEPSANMLCLRYMHRLASDPDALDRRIDRYVHCKEREARRERATAILAARKAPPCRARPPRK